MREVPRVELHGWPWHQGTHSQANLWGIGKIYRLNIGVRKWIASLLTLLFSSTVVRVPDHCSIALDGDHTGLIFLLHVRIFCSLWCSTHLIQLTFLDYRFRSFLQCHSNSGCIILQIFFMAGTSPHMPRLIFLTHGCSTLAADEPSVPSWLLRLPQLFLRGLGAVHSRNVLGEVVRPHRLMAVLAFLVRVLFSWSWLALLLADALFDHGTSSSSLIK